MQALRVTKSDDELAMMMRELDSTGEGALRFGDFARAVLDKPAVAYSRAEVLAGFRACVGLRKPPSLKYISLQQLTTAIMRGRDGLELAQAQAMIDQLPLSLFGTKGVMDFEEYVTIMMQE